MSTISLPFSGPTIATYQDGFGLVLQANSDTLWQSNSYDLSTWGALTFANVDGQPDNAVAIASLHREVWVVKTYDTEVWNNAGTTNFTFAREQGIFVEMGCAAPYSMCLAEDALVWLAQNRQGLITVVKTKGYGVERISTHAIERQFSTYSTVADCQAYSYKQEGHLFVVFAFPIGGETWVYDVTAAAWHQRASFGNGAFGRHWGVAGISYGGQIVVGDYRNGNLYAFDLNATTDNGTQRKWLRSWRAVKDAPEAPQAFASLQIDMQTGVNVPNGTAPQVVLRWSDDGCHTWSNEHYAQAGPPGATAQRVRFRRLGSTRLSTGLDRVFELSSTDAFPVALIGASINA